MIPYSKQSISGRDIRAVVKVLKSDFLTQGPVVPKFETALAEYTGANYAVATNSATSALHIALMAVGVKPGDRVWTSPISFVASANCALYCGAILDFIDIDNKTYNISINALRKKLEFSQKQGTLPKVIIPVHFAGQSCEMDQIFQLSKEFDFKIVEDASHALGGKYLGEMIGNCNFSDITVFSFHPVKIITTGEGGVAVTNNFNYFEKMCLLRSHGIIKREHEFDTGDKEILNYYQYELGFNYRMTDIQASLGLSQLNRLTDFVNTRHKIANFYNTELSNLDLILPWQHPNSYSSFHLYPIRIEWRNPKKNQIILYQYLRENKIGVNVHYIPIHLQPYFQKLGFKKGDFPFAEKYFRETISLPIHPSLSLRQQKIIIKTLKNFFIKNIQ